jgi:hypothetical protein
MSERSRFVLGFLLAAGLFGYAFPKLVSRWILAWFLSLGAGPSPWWGVLAVALGLVLLGFLHYMRPHSASLTGAFWGAFAATTVLVCAVPVMAYRSGAARAEFQRVLYRYREAPSSLKVLDGTGRVLWGLQWPESPARGVTAPLLEVRYGIVPQGGVQDAPPSGSPRPFVVGEAIEIRAEAPRHSFTAKGFARGPDRVEQLEGVGRNR